MTTNALVHKFISALLVRDMRETLGFFEKPGFSLSGSPPREENPHWAEVRRDSVVLQFYSQARAGTPTTPVCSGTFYIFPHSVTDLAEEFRDKVTFSWGPEVMEYGMLEFGIQDPSGYFFAFAEPA